ncbi:MarR family transcriptional regulator [Faecalibacter sp. LW9]|uniref:MarR family winged helix-turn-helix transcriptional regulator n=1 Tax=Faecalibacter sp. LW9 TaxID=3103144 RepID=UPI002B002E8C|nr:MarR family transcriptional regulator [Faecalibacter sp. LW9]
MDHSEDLKLSNQLCFPLYALSKEIINQYRPFLEALDLTYPQYLVMLVLWENDGLTVGQIGEKVFLDSGTLTPLLKRLELKGIISRHRSIEDERVVLISLTDYGKVLKSKACTIPQQMQEKINLTEEEIQVLKSIICKIKQS